MNEKSVRECIFVATVNPFLSGTMGHESFRNSSQDSPRVLIDQSDYSAREAPLGGFVVVCTLELYVCLSRVLQSILKELANGKLICLLPLSLY